jgi:hypothetical protein
VNADSSSDKTKTVVSLSVDGKATKGYITFNAEGKLDNYIHIEALRHLGLNSEEFSALIEAVTVKLDRTDIIGRIATNLYSSLPDWKKMGFQSSFMAKISEQERSATEGRMSTELTVFDAVSLSPSPHVFLLTIPRDLAIGCLAAQHDFVRTNLQRW